MTSQQAPGSPAAEDRDMFVIEDVAGIKALADPMRMRLLIELSGRPRTVKELAASLEVPQTRLYYHMKLLERHGLIRVVGRRMVSGIEERTYAGPADGWTVSPSLIPTAVSAGLLKAIFDLTRAEVEVALETDDVNLPAGDPSSNVPVLTFTRFFMSPEEVESFSSALTELFARYSRQEPRDGDTEYHGVFAAYRTQLPKIEEADDRAS